MTDVLSQINTVNQSNLGQVQLNTNPTQSETDAAQLADDFDEFLLLLTTQLENQDPTEPLDVNEMTNQLVLFSGVEQQIAGNALLEDLLSAQTGSAFDDAVQYIGQFVDAQGRAGELRAEDGIASFAYELDAAATDVDVIITNAQGQAVFAGQGSGVRGKNLVSWDGVNTFTGATEPAGSYFISVEARDGGGNAINSNTLTTGIVSGTQFNNQGQIVLTVAGTEVALDSVQAVRRAQ